MNTTKPSEIMKTRNDYDVLIFATMVFFIVIILALATDNYYRGEKEIEFVKVGLVQKVEEGKVIWTKP